MGDEGTRFPVSPVVLYFAGPAILIAGLLFFSLRPPDAKASAKVPTAEVLYRASDRMLKRGNETLDEIALTFDDGPHPSSLNRILDVLQERRIKATFFLVGRRIQEHPDAVRRILEAGHDVGNHTQNHRRLTGLTPDEAVHEITDCEDNFAKATGGKTMALFRPPGMAVDAKVFAITKQLGLTTVGWTNACKDFETEQIRLDPALSNQFFDRLYRGMRGGAILLLHDTPQTAEQLDEIIVYLQAAGYRFVKVSQMLKDLPEPVYLEANPDSR